jgi:hypothetical protein
VGLSFPEILRLALTDTGLAPSRLAIKLRKERTSVYKWLEGKHRPKPAQIPEIARVILENATASQKQVLMKHLVQQVKQSDLSEDIKETLCGSPIDYTDMLRDVLTLATNRSSFQSASFGKVGNKNNTLGMFRNRSGSKHFFSVPVCALVAAFSGGALWTLANQAFGWTYYSGSPGNEPYGLSAFVWGLLTLSPLVVIAVLLLRRHVPPRLSLFICLAYVITGCFSAWLFYTMGIRAGIASVGFAYELRELVVAVIYALMISCPPYIALRLLVKASISFKTTLLHVGLPIVAAFSAVVLTLFIGRPEIEIAAVRGLLVGLSMRSFMYFVIIKTLQCRLDKTLVSSPALKVDAGMPVS